MFSRLKARYLTFLKWLWIAAVLAAAVLYFSRNLGTIPIYFEQINLLKLILSLVFLLAAKALFALVSCFSVVPEGWDPSYLQMFSIYALTQPAKYIPGGIWHYVGRFGIYRSKEMTNMKAGRAMVLENVWLVSSAAAVGSGVIMLFNGADTIYRLWGYRMPDRWLVPGGLALLVVWVGVMVLYHRYLTSAGQPQIRLTLQTALTLTAAWILVGFSFYLLFPIGSAAPFSLAVGGFSISWAVGFLTVFAPGGIGIRELLLTFFFAGALPPELAPVLASVHRLVWVSSEILLGLVFSLPGIQKRVRGDGSGEGIVSET